MTNTLFDDTLIACAMTVAKLEGANVEESTPMTPNEDVTRATSDGDGAGDGGGGRRLGVANTTVAPVELVSYSSPDDVRRTAGLLDPALTDVARTHVLLQPAPPLQPVAVL